MEGFMLLLDVHGQPWTFGAASFAGVASPLKPDDPRMDGSGDRLFEVQVVTTSLPAIKPGRGDAISCAGKFHRITRPLDNDFATGITSILVVET